MILTPIFIISMLVAFVLVWLFVNTIDKRKWLTFLVSLVLAPLAYFYIFYPVVNIFSSYHHEKYFNAEAWEENPELRFEMLDNIIQDTLLIGKQKNEVKNLLGESEWFGWDDSIKANSPNKWNYNLGFEPGAFNNSQECIELDFENGKVTALRTYQLEKTFE
ncbi:hypothetical protein Q4566_03360 [Tamlana sp. 2_MG-2023]|uniref:hypothetical protein n=1 Tax=unclassified Tamlana TaxID=2614803 RepID=UPI0026E1C2D9|nr:MULTISPECIES: hypothetical protein [unclassified Tamlana]MDO6759224.1 hypothetical protein [Tamlana sp. 2_MG-2023]MDO6790637.1 hypothetical protein [Tamlana sp. 1_MG-2023]